MFIIYLIYSDGVWEYLKNVLLLLNSIEWLGFGLMNVNKR